jgi:hypothetical protein
MLLRHAPSLPGCPARITWTGTQTFHRRGRLDTQGLVFPGIPILRKTAESSRVSNPHDRASCLGNPGGQSFGTRGYRPRGSRSRSDASESWTKKQLSRTTVQY